MSWVPDRHLGDVRLDLLTDAAPQHDFLMGMTIREADLRSLLSIRTLLQSAYWGVMKADLGDDDSVLQFLLHDAMRLSCVKLKSKLGAGSTKVGVLAESCRSGEPLVVTLALIDHAEELRSLIVECMKSSYLACHWPSDAPFGVAAPLYYCAIPLDFKQVPWQSLREADARFTNASDDELKALHEKYSTENPPFRYLTFIVMRKYENTVERVLMDSSTTVEEGERILRRVVRSMQYLHDGVRINNKMVYLYHLDYKLDNLFLHQGRLVVGDWNFLTMIGEDFTWQSPFTREAFANMDASWLTYTTMSSLNIDISHLTGVSQEAAVTFARWWQKNFERATSFVDACMSVVVRGDRRRYQAELWFGNVAAGTCLIDAPGSRYDDLSRRIYRVRKFGDGAPEMVVPALAGGPARATRSAKVAVKRAASAVVRGASESQRKAVELAAARAARGPTASQKKAVERAASAFVAARAARAAESEAKRAAARAAAATSPGSPAYYTSRTGWTPGDRVAREKARTEQPAHVAREKARTEQPAHVAREEARTEQPVHVAREEARTEQPAHAARGSTASQRAERRRVKREADLARAARAAAAERAAAERAAAERAAAWKAAAERAAARDKNSSGALDVASPRSHARGLLGLNVDYTQKQLRKAYLDLARKTHPDKTAGDRTKFQRIKAAYDLLLGQPAPSESRSPRASASPRAASPRVSARAAARSASPRVSARSASPRVSARAAARAASPRLSAARSSSYGLRVPMEQGTPYKRPNKRDVTPMKEGTPYVRQAMPMQVVTPRTPMQLWKRQAVRMEEDLLSL